MGFDAERRKGNSNTTKKVNSKEQHIDGKEIQETSQ
jgi:hypothetical protein